MNCLMILVLLVDHLPHAVVDVPFSCPLSVLSDAGQHCHYCLDLELEEHTLHLLGGQMVQIVTLAAVLDFLILNFQIVNAYFLFSTLL